MVRDHLTLRNYKLRNIVLRLFKKTTNSYSDYGIWNTDFIEEFKNMEEYEFHIISPHNGMIGKKVVEFSYENINYHFFKCDSNLFVDAYRSYTHFDDRTEYKRIRKAVMGIVNRINPDVIIVCGAEQPNFSPAIWDLKDYPTLVLLETAINDPLLMKMMRGTNIYGAVEKRTFKEMRYFATGNKKYYNIVREFNDSAICLKVGFPTHRPPIVEIKYEEKRYDFVMFSAVLQKNKGVEDTIIAFNSIIKTHPKATLCVCGKADVDYMQYLETLVSIEAKDNVTFVGFFSSVDEKHKFVQTARYAVLPGITAPLNGTVREAMLMKMPTIVYETLLTPRINKDKHCLLCAKMSDVADLTDKMLFALDNPLKMKEYAANAYEYADAKYCNREYALILMNASMAVKDYFDMGKEIPNNLIYKPE